MRSIIKKARVITLSWIAGFGIGDLAPHLVDLLNKGIIKQWTADEDDKGYRITFVFPEGRIISMHQGDRD